MRHPRLHHKRVRTKKHKRVVLWLFLLNVILACLWGPIFISLTVAGPTRNLSSTVIWVAIISYYANMMGNIATAAGLYSSMVAHNAHETAMDAHETAMDTAEALDVHLGETS